MSVDAWIVLAVGVLLAVSAVLNGGGTALIAVSRARMLALEQDGSRRARRVNGLLVSPERIVGTVLIGNTLVNCLACALATSLLITWFGGVGVVYATVAMTVAVILFSEVLSKSYALAHADRTALRVAAPMRVLIALLRPFTSAVRALARLVPVAMPTQRDDQAGMLAAHDELRGSIALGEQGGGVAKADAEMLGAILDLRELQILDVMVHRTKMDTINADDAPGTVIRQILATQYSRLPVWRETPDNFIGVLHTKDLLAALARAEWHPEAVDVSTILTPPWFVPNTSTLKEQLGQFLARRTQLALVVDEYGEVQGLVTLEDILEEIVGQISDEHDTETQIKPLADGSLSVEGVMPIRDLNRAMGWDLPDDAATTIAGLIMHEAQMIPEVGQAFTFHGYRFEVVRKQRNRITGVRVRRLPPIETGAGLA